MLESMILGKKGLNYKTHGRNDCIIRLNCLQLRDLKGKNDLLLEVSCFKIILGTSYLTIVQCGPLGEKETRL